MVVVAIIAAFLAGSVAFGLASGLTKWLLGPFSDLLGVVVALIVAIQVYGLVA